jgi:hypothetical protein
MRVLSIGCLALILCAGSAQAQTAEPVSPDSAVRQAEVDTWLKEAKEYKRWIAKFRNRVNYNWVGQPGKRKEQPQPPAWLPAHCASVDEEQAVKQYAEACQVLKDLQADAYTMALAQQVEQTAAARADKEKPRRSRVWERIHFDTMWFATELGNKSFGMVGVHFTIVEVGRVQIFGPPGVILMSVPVSVGKRRIQPAYTWGVSVRLFDFRFPGIGQHATAHFNMAKAWSIGRSDSVTAAESGMNLGGISFTWRDLRP